MTPSVLSRRTSYLLILLFTLLAYGPALNAPFLFDDHQAIERNDDVKHWDARSWRHDFHLDADSPWGQAYFRPFQMLTHRIDVTLWGLNPRGHHLTNLVIHLGCAWLLFELVLLLGLGMTTAACCGVLFGVHPIIVSELLMVSGRPELLSLFFCLGALLLFEQTHPIAAVLGGLCFFAGLLSKESALALPLYIILVRWARRDSSSWRRVTLTCAVVLVAYFLLRYFGGSLYPMRLSWTTVPAFLLGELPLVFLKSISLLVFPWPLYLYRLSPSVPFWIGLFSWLLLAVAFLWTKQRNRWATFGLLWIAAAWVPKIPVLLTGRYMFDHWSYPALPGLLIPLCVALKSPAVKKAVLALLVIGWTFSTQLNIALRNTDFKTYRWSLRYTRAVPLYVNLGLLYLQAGNPEEAITYFKPALDAFPNDPAIRAAYEAAEKALHSHSAHDSH